MAQFSVEGFKCTRKDGTGNKGGLLYYIRIDLAHRRRTDLEDSVTDDIESMNVEVIIRKQKWIFIELYKPPMVKQNALIAILQSIQGTVQCIYMMGDININMNVNGTALNNVLDIFDMHNVIHEPTCFKNVHNPSLIDVILTDSPRRICDTLNVNTGISDCHNIICAATKIHVPRVDLPIISYRSMKPFKEQEFMDTLASAPFHVGNIFDDVILVLQQTVL